MKKLQLAAGIFCLAILLSSCARNYHLELVGHYKPNTDVVKNQATLPTAPSDNIIQPLSAGNENEGVASSGVTEPDLQPRQSPQVQPFPSLTPKQEQKLEKKIEKLKEKVEKHVTQSGKQIQQNDLSSTEKKSHSGANDNQLLCAIIAIFIPWLGVLLYEGEVTNHFWIDLLLWFLFYLPGLIYALYIILRD